MSRDCESLANDNVRLTTNRLSDGAHLDLLGRFPALCSGEDIAYMRLVSSSNRCCNKSSQWMLIREQIMLRSLDTGVRVRGNLNAQLRLGLAAF